MVLSLPWFAFSTYGKTRGHKDHVDKSVVISEVMVLGSNDDPFGPQWVELFNRGEQPVNLQGLVLQTKSGGFYVISLSKDLTLRPKDYVVLTAQGNPKTQEGRVNTYSVGQNFSLDQESDTIQLSREGDILDSFTYGGVLTPRKGIAFNREPKDEQDPWCYARIPMEGESGDLGTPGRANTYCDNDGDGFAEDQGDCNDSNSKINPNAHEICNGLDDN